MSELKTLKDLEFDIYTEVPIKGTGLKKISAGPFIIPKELRNEAIKWIKDIREGHSFKPIPMPKEEFTDNMTINCFKCFFNILEEDLK